MIANPDYFEDNKIYAFKSNAAVGLEIWQVKSGTIFDNVIVTNDMAEANKLAEKTKKLQAAEKAQVEKENEEKRKKQEEERAKMDKDEEEEHDVKDEL